MALWMGGFPAARPDAPIRLDMKIREDETRWTRRFGHHETASRLHYDGTRAEIVERFGMIRVGMRPTAQNGQLHLEITRMSVLGLPVPRWFLPKSETRESADAQGRLQFDVSARLPVIGLLIRYQGWLVPCERETRAET